MVVRQGRVQHVVHQPLDAEAGEVRLDLEAALLGDHEVEVAAPQGRDRLRRVPELQLDETGPIVRRVHRVHEQLVAPNRALAGAGAYLLTIGPASGGKGLAPVSGLGNEQAGCNLRYLVEGVEFRMIAIPDAATCVACQDRLEHYTRSGQEAQMYRDLSGRGVLR